MRLILLTALVMTLFAANSLLNRLALAEGAIGAAEFAAIRLAAGAVMLAAIVAGRDHHLRALQRAEPWGIAGLALYMLGFSFAYLWLDAGLGALILFGGVQITMFAGAHLGGEALDRWRIGGAALAFTGLAWLSSPAGAAPDPAGVALMATAALGWGIYSLRGARAGDALAATAGNFLYATPLAVLAVLLFASATPSSPTGIGLAVLSGAVTSGMGYALWYAVLPRIAASAAAVAQLTVPVIAMAGGILLLGETPGLRAMLAAMVVLGGVGLALSSRLRRR